VVLANQTMADYRSALHFLTSRFEGWQTPVMTCSSLNTNGVAEVWGEVSRFKAVISKDGRLQQQRAQQAKAWMWSEMAESLVVDLKADTRIKHMMPELESAVLDGSLPATVAAQRMIMIYKKNGD
jgi:LAO/AO transport system kinase